MKRILATTLITAVLITVFGFTITDQPVKAKKMASKAVTVGTAIGDEAPEISMAGLDGRD